MHEHVTLCVTSVLKQVWKKHVSEQDGFSLRLWRRVCVSPNM